MKPVNLKPRNRGQSVLLLQDLYTEMVAFRRADVKVFAGVLQLKNPAMAGPFSEGNSPSRNQSNYIVQSGRDCMDPSQPPPLTSFLPVLGKNPHPLVFFLADWSLFVK